MGATNTTANYNLSQFVGTDKPAWLQDYNGDMLKIDTGINAAKVAADGAQNTADAAQNDATTANNAITNTINPAISSLNTLVGNQGGAINTINSLIGNGTPTTTDQTIIGAINEINAELTPVDITSLVTFNSAFISKVAIYYPATKSVRIRVRSSTTDMPTGNALFIVPSDYEPDDSLFGTPYGVGRDTQNPTTQDEYQLKPVQITHTGTSFFGSAPGTHTYGVLLDFEYVI